MSLHNLIIFMNFLSNDSLLGKITGRIWTIVLTNILFLFCSIPIVTIGTSYTAMYYTLLRAHRYEGEKSVIKDFFHGFKSNLKQSLIVWIITLAGIFICLTDLSWFKEMNTSFSHIGYCVIAGIGILILITLFYLFPVMAAFDNTITNLIKHAIYFAVSSIPNLLMICFANVFPIFLTYNDLSILPVYAFIWCFFGFGLVAYFNSSLLIRQFNEFLPEVEDPNEIISDTEILDNLRNDK